MKSRGLRGTKADIRGLLAWATVSAYVGLFILAPYLIVLAFSFWKKTLYSVKPAFTVANYDKIFQSTLYFRIILNSFEVAIAVTLTVIVMGYILAYYLSRYSGQFRGLLFFLLVVPLWTSYLLRAYVWTIILGREGIINSFLLKMGIISHPISIILYSQFSIDLALIYIFIPFVALPVYAALEKIPPEYLEASEDLGARGWNTFFSITLPLTAPALVAGAAITFCLSFGDFITPTLLGGSSDIMISNVILKQFGAAFNWPLGSALAIVVMFIVLIVVGVAMTVVNKRVGYKL